MAEITLEFDTIAAISTPPGEGAISIVRLSGDQAVQLADKVYQSGNKRLSEVPSHTIHYGHVVDPKSNQLVDEVETEIFNREEKEIPSTLIGEIVMDKIKNLDSVAYVRFASVYREFKDVNTFMSELKKMLDK